tara:strand:- start:1126 stop:1371 length:246 start_codon:yes stop_codon:yes gene_type:complete
MNGSEWHKNDTTYYVVYYTETDGDRVIDVVTNDFDRWLEKTNEDRVDDWEEAEETGAGVKYDADDFWLEEVEVFSRKGEIK